jgi:hypothetical protein
VSPLQQLAEVFAELAQIAELAQTGNEEELISALDLCLGFADRVVHDYNVDEMLAKLSESDKTERTPIRRLN